MIKNSGDWKGLQGHNDDPTRFKQKAWVHDDGDGRLEYVYLGSCLYVYMDTCKYVCVYIYILHVYMFVNVTVCSR